MDAFKSVDNKNLNKVYRSDGQSDWMKWNQGAEGKQQLKGKGAVYKKSRHTPAFPKLGTSTNTDSKDDSNYKIGWHEQVLVPELETDRKKRVNRAKEHLQKEEEKEREIIELKRKRQNLQQETAEAPNQESQLNLPPGWVILTEPDTDKEYYFNQSTGETMNTHPAAGVEGELDRDGAVSSENLQSFIPTNSFAGAKPGYVFKLGIEGVGYYPDVKPKPKVLINNDTCQTQSSRSVNHSVKTKSNKKRKQKHNHNVSSTPQQTYAASLMDVASNALSSFYAKQQGEQHQQLQAYESNNYSDNSHKHYLQQSRGNGLYAGYASNQNSSSHIYHTQSHHSYGQQHYNAASNHDANLYRHQKQIKQQPKPPPPIVPPTRAMDEWRTLTDPLTRRTYYLNTRTQETTYNKPF